MGILFPPASLVLRILERKGEGFRGMRVEDADDLEMGDSRSIPVSPRTYNWLTNFHRDLLAGAFMGGLVHTIVAPIERAKLLLQTQESNLAIVGVGRRRFKGMFDCIFRTVREEGILSLWRGNGSSVIRYYPSVALNFSLKVSSISFHFGSFLFLFSDFICH